MPQATGDRGAGLKAVTLASLSWMVLPMVRKVLGVLPAPRVVARLDLRAVVDAAAVERLEADHRQKSDHDRLRQVVACDFHGLQPPIAQRGRVQIGEALAPRGARVAQPRLGVRRRT
jgi:hypothetical protein